MAAGAVVSRDEQVALGTLVAHPMRCQLLLRFAERSASTVEIAHELGVDVRNLSYHVRALARAGAIEAVGKRRVRGSIETFYRATALPFFDTDEFAELSGDERRAFVKQILSLVTAAAAASIEAKCMFERPDAHISRVPMRIDEEGWQKLSSIFDRMLEEVLQVKEESEMRLAASEDRATSVVAFATFFELPEQAGPAG